MKRGNIIYWEMDRWMEREMLLVETGEMGELRSSGETARGKSQDKLFSRSTIKLES